MGIMVHPSVGGGCTMASVISLISSVLSLSLVMQGAPSSPSLNPGVSGFQVAQLQSTLDALGFNAGPVTGTVNAQTLTAAAAFTTQFGPSTNRSIYARAPNRLSAIGTLPSNAAGPTIVAVQSWLSGWHLYHGALNGKANASLALAVAQFQKQVGLPQSGHLNGTTLRMMSHLQSVKVIHMNGWSYHAMSGDTLTTLAFATGVSVSQLKNANIVHNGNLWQGQVVHWKRIVHASSPSSSAHSSTHSTAQPSSSPSSDPLTGPYSKLDPSAALVVMNPSTSAIRRLIKAEASMHGLHGGPDVVVTGEWLLNHARLARSLQKAGNEVDTAGYSGTDLNTLPGWGVRQELTWSRTIFRSTFHQAPAFLVTPWTLRSSVVATASTMGLVAMNPSKIFSGSATRALDQTLLSSPSGIIAINDPSVRWKTLLTSLANHHFVFLTLGQIWANGST